MISLFLLFKHILFVLLFVAHISHLTNISSQHRQLVAANAHTHTYTHKEKNIVFFNLFQKCVFSPPTTRFTVLYHDAPHKAHVLSVDDGSTDQKG